VKRDTIFQSSGSASRKFEFDEEVAEVFDDMLQRSIPFYEEQQRIVVKLAKRFWKPETYVYDLGCSTATTIINLCREFDGAARFIGYDSSLPLIKKAERKVRDSGLSNRIELRYGDLSGDLTTLSLEKASVITLCWTLQFIPPPQREKVIQWIYKGLVAGGALLLTEKIVLEEEILNDLFIDSYHDYKRRNGYSEQEIIRKEGALKDVLIPYSIQQNLALLNRNGFAVSEPFFQWFNFIGVLCVKTG